MEFFICFITVVRTVGYDSFRFSPDKAVRKCFAQLVKPLIEGLKQDGYTTIRALKDALNHNHVPTFTGRKALWHNNTVHRLLKRLDQTQKNIT